MLSALRASARVCLAIWTVVVLVGLASLVAIMVAGWRVEAIASPSMTPAIPEGSAALVEPIGSTAIARLEAGDVILFEHPNAERLVMHRVASIVEQRGERFFETKGDANDRPDARLVPAASVESRVRGSVPRLGNLLTAFEPPAGLIWLVAVPWVLFSFPEFVARRRGRVIQPTATFEGGTS